jgi:hypothetical protein
VLRKTRREVKGVGHVDKLTTAFRDANSGCVAQMELKPGKHKIGNVERCEILEEKNVRRAVGA